RVASAVRVNRRQSVAIRSAPRSREARDPRASAAKASGAWLRRGVGVEKAVKVDDEVAHMRVVHGALRHRLPGLVGLRIARIHADDVQRAEVGELDVGERLELAAEHEVKQLLGWPALSVDSCHGASLLSRSARWPFPI